MKRVLLFVLIFIPCLFLGCAKQNVVKLDAPKNLVVENGNIKFERVANEGYYSIDINGFEILADINNSKVEIYSENNINYFEYNAQNLLNVGENYTIKVQARASGKKSSDYVLANYVHHAKLNAPTNVAILGKILSWAAVENAENYLVDITMPGGQKVTRTAVKNSLNLTDVLLLGGEYGFSVKAQTSNENFLNSDATTKKFENFVELNTPTNLNVDEDANLSAEVDERANAVELKINNVQRIVEKQNNNVQVEGEVWNFNIKNLLAIFGGQIDFSVLGNYDICLRAVFVTNAKNYYSSSAFSETATYLSTQKLNAPNVEIEERDNLKILKFNSSQSEFVSGFEVEINLGESSVTYVFDQDVNNFVLPNNFVSVSVTALGKGFYLNSSAQTLTNN